MNYLPCEFGGVSGCVCEVEALGVKLRLWVPSQDQHTGHQGGAGMVPGTPARFKPCAFLENKSLEQNVKTSARQQVFCQYFSN